LTLKVVSFLAAVLWLASALLWALGASVEIRESQDDFIADLKSAGRWNSRAAIAACGAAVVSGLVALFEVLR
jgi:hypothetical protein